MPEYHIVNRLYENVTTGARSEVYAQACAGFVEGARYTPRPVSADLVGKAYDWRALVPEALRVEFEAACLAYQLEVLAC